MVVSTLIALIITGVIFWVVLRGYAPYLWAEWVTSVDHKKIGVMSITAGSYRINNILGPRKIA